MTAVYRCRKCRQNLDIQNAVIEGICGCTVSGSKDWCNVLYIDVDSSPEWIRQAVEDAAWLKGKILCTKCKGRLGSFDFIHEKLCDCGQHPMPPVHLLKNRIDEVCKSQLLPPVTRIPMSEVQHTLQRLSVGPERLTAIPCQSQANAPLNGNDTETVPNALQGAYADSVGNKQDDTEELDFTAEFNTAYQKMQNQFVFVQTKATKEYPTCDNSAKRCLEDEAVKTSNLNKPTTDDDSGFAVDSGVAAASEDAHDFDVAANSGNAFDLTRTILMEGIEGFNVFNKLPMEEMEQEDALPHRKKEDVEIPSDMICAVCLEMFYRPHRCEPCDHIFCENCLRQVCKQTPTLTPCPLCRNVICRCVFQSDLNDELKAKYDKHFKERRHESRKNMSAYALPSCSPFQYNRYLDENGRSQGIPWSYRREQNFILTRCAQEILIRFAWLMLMFIVHNILLSVDHWLDWKMYADRSVTFNYFLWTLTCKLILFGIIYCLKKYFRVNIEYNFTGQAVLFVFIFSVLWDTDSWIQFMLNMAVLGSLFL